MAKNRQYITTGSINGRPVRYLVDTGANVVAINANTARNLGLRALEGRKVPASTASDDIEVTTVMIKEMVVGDITRNNVQAIIVDGKNPKDVLLGPSFSMLISVKRQG